MAGIPSKNVPSYNDGDAHAPQSVDPGVAPDPGTGSMYNSMVPVSDIAYIFLSSGLAPHVPAIVTQGSLLGILSEDD